MATLVSGNPGSGKSTLTRRLRDGGVLQAQMIPRGAHRIDATQEPDRVALVVVALLHGPTAGGDDGPA